MHPFHKSTYFSYNSTDFFFNGNAQILWFCRQGGKDQAKKGSNIKLGLQGDKKGLGQDPRKDSSIDGGHHLKVMYCNKKKNLPLMIHSLVIT